MNNILSPKSKKEFEKILNRLEEADELEKKEFIKKLYINENGKYTLKEGISTVEKSNLEEVIKRFGEGGGGGGGSEGMESDGVDSNVEVEILNKGKKAVGKGGKGDLGVGEGSTGVALTKLENLLKSNKEKVESLDAQVKEQADMLRRKQAEFENYKKRTERERVEYRVLANKKLLEDLLPVADSLTNALNVDVSNVDDKALYDGVILIGKQLSKFMESKGVERIEAEGKEFDPLLHEAIQVVDGDAGVEYKTDTVVKEWQTGYMLKGKMLRHSKVVIVKASVGEADSVEGLEVPKAINDRDFIKIVDELKKAKKENVEIIISSYDKGEGEYIIKDSISGNKNKLRALKEVLSAVNKKNEII